MSETPYSSPVETGAGFEEPPSLKRDVAFWGMAGTQFFGAFNDNVFKQIVLLLAVRSTLGDIQGPAMVLFAAPFIMFSGIAGFYSEKSSKKRIIVLSKAAEVLVMTLGMFLLLAYQFIGIVPNTVGGLSGLFVILFLMGAQSAFFGPGKFGILPEMLRERDLPAANGVVLMSTFLAIIFGVALAGPCVDFFIDRLNQPWLSSAVCVVIAVIGFAMSLTLRETPPANPQLEFHRSALWIPDDVWKHLWKEDHPLLRAVLVTCMFWLVGGMVMPAVNNLGKEQLLKDHPFANTWTSVLAASMGFGIALGCVTSGLVSRGRANFGLMRFGCAGTVVCLVILSLPDAKGSILLGYWGSLTALVLLGIFTGFFIVPLQVFLQSRPPKGQKGRIIATMNLVNWIAILLSALLYWVLFPIFERLNWVNGLFLVTAVFMFPVAAFYRPTNKQ